MADEELNTEAVETEDSVENEAVPNEGEDFMDEEEAEVPTEEPIEDVEEAPETEPEPEEGEVPTEEPKEKDVKEEAERKPGQSVPLSQLPDTIPFENADGETVEISRSDLENWITNRGTIGALLESYAGQNAPRIDPSELEGVELPTRDDLDVEKAKENILRKWEMWDDDLNGPAAYAEAKDLDTAELLAQQAVSRAAQQVEQYEVKTSALRKAALDSQQKGFENFQSLLRETARKTELPGVKAEAEDDAIIFEALEALGMRDAKTATDTSGIKSGAERLKAWLEKRSVANETRGKNRNAPPVTGSQSGEDTETALEDDDDGIGINHPQWQEKFKKKALRMLTGRSS